jgi:hypothetical protein
MVAFPSDNNDRTFEALCNALVTQTVFVTRAVDMKGLPVADQGEAAFIGRSNVGKILFSEIWSDMNWCWLLDDLMILNHDI